MVFKCLSVRLQGMDLHRSCDIDVPCLPLGKVELGRGLEEEDESAPKMVQQIYYEFFSKPMKPKLVILSDSALPWQQKRTVLTQECIRRL